MLIPHPDGQPDRLSPPAGPAGPVEGVGAHTPTSQSHPAVPQTLAPTPTLPGLLVAFRRRCVLALSLAVIGGGCVAVAAWRFVPEPKYQVRAMVHIASVPEKILGGTGGGNETQFSYFQKTQVTLVKSQVVLEKVLRDPEIARLRVVRRQASPKDWLVGVLEADFKQGPEVLTIAIKGDDGEDLVTLVNAITTAYLDEFINTEHTRIRVRLQKLEELKRKHSAVLNEKRSRLRELAPRLGGGQMGLLGGLQDGILKQIANANEELQSVQAELTRTEVALKQGQARVVAAKAYKVPESVIDRELDMAPALKRYQDEVSRLEDKVNEMHGRAASAEKANEFLRANGTLAEMERARKALEGRRKEVRAEVIDRLKAKRLSELESGLEQTQETLTYLRVREKQLLKVLSDRALEASAQGEEAFKLSLLAREVEEEDKIVTAATNEMRSLRLDMVSPPRAKPLDQAVVAPNLGKKRLLLTLGGGGGVFLIAVLAVSWWEFSKRKVEFVDEVVHGFGIGVVGTLPLMRRPRRRQHPGPAGGWSGYIDSFRTILLRGRPRGELRVLLVTSAEAGEGKTSLSAHLAVSLARSGQKTLLLEGDMRSPTAHRLFGLPRGPGLSEVLKEREPPQKVVLPTAISGLWMMPAGAWDASAVERLTSGAVARLFSQLKEGFDVVVVDSCPILPVADTLHLAQHADGVIFSVLRRVSRLPKVSAALHRVRMIGTPVLGAVVNGTNEDVYSHEYYTPLQATDI